MCFIHEGGAGWGFIAKTGDPERALRNLLERDEMFTQCLFQEAQRLGLNTIEVNHEMTVAELSGRVAEMFGI